MTRRKRESPIAVYGALAANMGIVVAKYVVAVMTGSSAILSEAIHSTVDTGNELLLLLGLHRAREREVADGEHPYGHGKELYFWGFVVAIVIFAGGGGMAFYEGIVRLEHGAEPTHGLVSKLVVLGVALAFESGSFAVAVGALRRTQPKNGLWRALRRSKDPSIYTVVALYAPSYARRAITQQRVCRCDLWVNNRPMA